MSLVVPPTTVDMTLYQGASWIEAFRWDYGSTVETAIPVDLSTCTGRATIKPEYNSDILLAEANTVDGTMTLDASGNIVINVPGEDVAVNIYDYKKGTRQIEIYWLDGAVCRLVQGKVTISFENKPDV